MNLNGGIVVSAFFWRSSLSFSSSSALFFAVSTKCPNVSPNRTSAFALLILPVYPGIGFPS